MSPTSLKTSPRGLLTTRLAWTVRQALGALMYRTKFGYRTPYIESLSDFQLSPSPGSKLPTGKLPVIVLRTLGLQRRLGCGR
jgi:hypothetical protein